MRECDTPNNCEHAHVERFDLGKARRYKCSACGVLLYRRRDHSPLKTYRCKFVSKVGTIENGQPVRKRILSCGCAATHIGANDTAFCDLHGHPRVSKAKISKRKRIADAAKAREKADLELADRVTRESRERATQGPLRTVKQTGGLGGVILL